MDLKEIKQIVDLMKRSELTEFEIEEQDFKLRICRDNGQRAEAAPAPGATNPPMPVPQAPVTIHADKPAETAKEDASVSVVKSPMVGTFYRAPSPDSKPFVDVGTKVTDDTVVCIIEAMKVMNEINAELSGTVSEILVENGEAVEYGQPMFKVKRS